MSVQLYKNVDVMKIRFSDTIKKKIQTGITMHVMDMYHNNAPIFIQFNQCICRGVDSNCLILDIPKDVHNFVKGFEEYIIDTVYTKSEKWFRGKRFTMSKIQSGLISCLKDGKLIVMINETSVFFNQFKKTMTLEELKFPCDCTCVVRLCCLQFVGNRFTCKISVEQCKVNVDYRLKEYSIIETDSITPITETSYPEYYNSEDFFP
jgi:hypothetical protein